MRKMGIDYNKQRKDWEDNNGASGESIVDYWGSSHGTGKGQNESLRMRRESILIIQR